jgi:hypothetical protein
MPHLSGRVRAADANASLGETRPRASVTPVSLSNASYHGKAEFVAAWGDHGSAGGVPDADFAPYHRALWCATRIGAGDPSHNFDFGNPPAGPTDYDGTIGAESG